MTDIWSNVIQRDPYELRYEAALDSATAALSSQFAFITEASTKASYIDRLDIVAERIEAVVGAATNADQALFAPVHEAVLSQWEQDFDAIVAARASESQRTGNRRGWFRKQKRQAVTKTALDMDQATIDAWTALAPGTPIRVGFEEDAENGVFVGLFQNSNPEFYGNTPLVIYSLPDGRERSFIPARTEVPRPARTASKKIAMTAAEATSFLSKFPDELKDRVAALSDMIVYGPEYNRNVTENLGDALRFSGFATGGDDAEYFLRKAEAQAEYQRSGDWQNPMHPRQTPEQQSMLGRKANYNDEFWAMQNAHAAEPHAFTDNGFHDTDDHNCVICGQPRDFPLHDETPDSVPTGAAAVTSKTAGDDSPFQRAVNVGLMGGSSTQPQNGAMLGGWAYHVNVPSVGTRYVRDSDIQTGDRDEAQRWAKALLAKWPTGYPLDPKTYEHTVTEADIREFMSGIRTASLKPLAFEAALSAIKTTNDPAVLMRMLAGNRRRREGLVDVVLEASLNAQDEIAKVRLAQLGVTFSSSNNDDFTDEELIDWSAFGKEKGRQEVDINGNPVAVDEVIDWARVQRKGVLSCSFGTHAVTLVREGGLVHWAVTDDAGDAEAGADSAPTVRDALEQAWDVLNKVLDKEPPPSDEIVQEVTDAAQATSDAVEQAGGQAPEDAAATDGKPVADPDKDPVHPADPQPNDKKADPALEAKPSAPVDDIKTDPTDVKVDPDTKAAEDPNAKPDPNDPTKITKDPNAPAPDPDAKAADPNAKPEDAKVPPSNDAPPQADGDTPADPNDVVDTAEDKSMGDVLGIDPSTMETGQATTMTYTLSDGTVGDTNVTFLREDNGIYFFDGPNGEFGLGQREDQWVDADGNSFAFSNGDAVEEVTGDDDAANGAQLEDIDLDVPVDKKEDAPADGDKAPAKDDSKDDDDKDKKDAPPWAKSKKSMLEENPWMTDELATRLAQRSASLAQTLTGAK